MTNIIKENEVEELFDKIVLLKESIKEKSSLIKQIKKDINKKDSDKTRLQNELQILEDKKGRKLEKLEIINNILNGEQNIVNEFKINKAELFDMIPKTPVEGSEEILKRLTDLKLCFSGEEIIKTDDDIRYINIKYMGQMMKYIYPNNPNYYFKNLLYDVCQFFGLKNPNEYTFKDDINYIWPLNTSVADFMNTTSK
jgi:hypothetical protein